MSVIADDDSQQNFILAFVLALIALVIFFVIGIALYSQAHKAPARTAPRRRSAGHGVAVVTETVVGRDPRRREHPRGRAAS